VSLFDLIFLLVILLSVITLATGIAFAFRGKIRQAAKIFAGYCVFALVYLAIGAAVSYLRPQRIIAIGEPWCFDEWCLTVNKVGRVPESTNAIVKVDLILSSQSRGRPQRAQGAWIYLIDPQGHRFAPQPDPAATPLDTLLQPGESIPTSRSFVVPPDARELGLITGHGGPYCGPMSILIISSSGCLFHKPDMVRLPR